MTDQIVELYKYYPINDYLIDTINYSQIWFSHPDSLNDPFDGNIRFANIKDERYENEIGKILKKERKKSLNHSDYYLKQKRLEELSRTMGFRNDYNTSLLNLITGMRQKQIGISCFSKKYNSILMWSHYASNHTGVCLKFNTTDQTFFDKIHPVIYANNIPTIKERTEFSEPEDYLFYIKSKDWEYESEVRIIKKPNRLYKFNPNILSAVYFGVKCTNDEKTKIIDIIRRHEKYKDIKFYQMKLELNGFELVENEIESKY